MVDIWSDTPYICNKYLKNSSLFCEGDKDPSKMENVVHTIVVLSNYNYKNVRTIANYKKLL